MGIHRQAVRTPRGCAKRDPEGGPFRGFRTASRGAYDAPASRRITLLAGNLDRPSQRVIIKDRWYKFEKAVPGVLT